MQGAFPVQDNSIAFFATTTCVQQEKHGWNNGDYLSQELERESEIEYESESEGGGRPGRPSAGAMILVLTLSLPRLSPVPIEAAHRWHPIETKTPVRPAV